MRRIGKVVAVLCGLVVVGALVWRLHDGRPLVRIDIPAEEQTPQAQTDTTERVDLIVSKDGDYVLDGTSISQGSLDQAIANLRSAKHGVAIDVVAAPGAPPASIAKALAATHVL